MGSDKFLRLVAFRVVHRPGNGMILSVRTFLAAWTRDPERQAGHKATATGYFHLFDKIQNICHILVCVVLQSLVIFLKWEFPQNIALSHVKLLLV